jgi:diguanylate cyclase (GGDEF)-like protein
MGSPRRMFSVSTTLRRQRAEPQTYTESKRGRRVCPFAFLLVVLTLCALPPPALAGFPAELTSVSAIRVLTSNQAREARPVHLKGVVTVVSGWKSSFFFQDPTSGISVDRLTAVPELHSGEEIEIQGVTGGGQFAPIINAKTVTVLGKGTLPPAPLFTPAELAGGKQDSQFLTIRGIVRSTAVRPSWGRSVLFLNVDIGGGDIVAARVHDFTQSGYENLPAATVAIRGVSGTVFNNKRQFIGIRVFVASLDEVKIEKPAPVEPFDLPVRPLGGLLQFDDTEGPVNRVKLRGFVTYAIPGEGLYIQDKSSQGTVQGAFIQSGQATPVPLGSQVEAVGYPAAGRYAPKLDNAIYRVIGPVRPAAPLTRSATEMITTSEGFSSAPYDSLLVQVTAHLIEEIHGNGEDLLLFQDGLTVFTARLPRAGNTYKPLDTQSLLSITGICAATADDAHEVRTFEILLRSPADLVVLEKAPWWTASHAAWVVGLLILVVLGMLGWLALVRRQTTLRAMAIRDPLTGLFNRRGFLLLAEQQWQSALRGRVPFLLFYIDVDLFKGINDTFGHKEGDVALRAVADLLRECFRKSDIIGRLGGDEFAVAAIEAKEPSRATLERRIASAVQQSNEKVGRPFRLSLSVGVLTCDISLGPVPIEDLLARADELMYEQKREHRSHPSINVQT